MINCFPQSVVKCPLEADLPVLVILRKSVGIILSLAWAANSGLSSGEESGCMSRMIFHVLIA